MPLLRYERTRQLGNLSLKISTSEAWRSEEGNNGLGEFMESSSTIFSIKVYARSISIPPDPRGRSLEELAYQTWRCY
jgi:hypothetical protein